MDIFDHNYWGVSIINNDQLPSTTNITIVIFQCIVYSNVGRVHLHRNYVDIIQSLYRASFSMIMVDQLKETSCQLNSSSLKNSH